MFKYIDAIIILGLLVISGLWFGWHHAYGAYGDDAPGYIYLAHDMLTGGDLVKQDPLVKQALDWFGAEPLARFVAPAHYEIISPIGWTASRYPIGLSLLMAGAALITGNVLAMYWVVPLSAMSVVILTYLISLKLFNLSEPWKRLVGLGSAVVVLGCGLFAQYAAAQPMREIPSMVFFMLAFYLILLSKKWYVVLLAGLSMALSLGIRETSIILLIPLVLTVFMFNKKNWKVVGVCLMGIILGYSIFLVQAVDITLHKEKFRDKDVTRIAITSNIDHIQSLAIHNLWNNQGKFKPGVGGLKQYWEVTQQFSAWPLFIIFIIVGAVYLWKKQRAEFWVLLSWVSGIILLFGMWINPYPRYILPILPVLGWLSLVGLFYSHELFVKLLKIQKTISVFILVLLGLSFVLSYQPIYAAQQTRLQTGAPLDRELTYDDLINIQTAITTVQTDAGTTGKTPLLLMLGATKGGLSETIMSHTTIKVIRFPSKDKEQPPLEQLTSFISQLQETYTIYLWYDASVSAQEQRFYNQYVVRPVTTTTTSFQPNISIYAITE
ncbi:MAG: hypothetical protein WCV88_04235 [Patescibacteria group bacterium]|jgi:hypothetical protein